MALAVKTCDLVKDFHGVKAVNHLSLRVPEGAIYGFLGPNGSGKTTTLKMLTGMTKPTSGTIEILGVPMVFGKEKTQEAIGFLPDVPGFYDWMTAHAFLTFCGELYHIAKPILKERVKSLLNIVGLEKSDRKKIGTYSRGMKQRLGIAQALINEPKVIFLDEPVSALDPQGRKEVIDIIQGLKGKVTVFFSTHILSDVERICDRVVIINEGMIILEDTIENIKAMSNAREIEIETDPSSMSLLEEMIGRKPYVLGLNVNHQTMTVTVDDLDVARLHLNEVIFSNNILIRRLMIKEPTLEDIYMRVVSRA